MSAGIYVHVPFCLRKCPYCSFYSVAYDKELTDKYVDALCKHINSYKNYALKADTIYFGGGTPSLLNLKQINKIISEIYNSFKIENAEITLEANPSSLNYEKLIEYHQFGINRISIGVQSADDEQLKFLGRLHDFKTAEKAVCDSYKAGIENISCDIMLGLAGQTIRSLNRTIDKISLLPVKHISAYILKIEKNTKFDNDFIRSSVANEDMQCDMYLNAVERLDKYGFEQYEISNFAKSGYYSRHNIKYWQREEYIGFGPSAHSFFKNRRFCCSDNLLDYIENPVGSEFVTEAEPDKAQEYIMLSLRLKSGLSLNEIRENFNQSKAEIIRNKAKKLQKNGLCNVGEDRISLTPQGFLVSNSIISYFLG